MYTYLVRVGRKYDKRYKLTDDEISSIKNDYSSGNYTRKKLSEIYGVSFDCIRYHTDENWRNRPAATKKRNLDSEFHNKKNNNYYKHRKEIQKLIEMGVY